MCLDAHDRIKQDKKYRGEVKRLFKKALDEFHAYENNLIYTRGVRFFHMDDMSDADIVAWAMTALTCLKIASVSYDIGDEVWTLDFFDEPHKGEILSINTYSHYKDKKRDYISYYIHHIGNRNEREIFKTKEELLKQGRK